MIYNLKKITESLLDSVVEAGEIAKEISQRGVKITIKADHSPVTDGDVAVDKLLKNMPLPGKDKGMNMEDMMNGDMMKNMGDMMGNMMGGEMGDMMKGIMGDKEEEKEPTIIDDNFSTADVEVGQDELDKKGKGMIGNMMNMANNIPSMEGIGGLGELGGMMKDLTSGDMDLDNLENIKGKMDNFMEKTLGVDMSEFNKNMENLVGKMENNTEMESNEGEHKSTPDVNSLD